MHIKLTMIGKTNEAFVKNGMEFYRKRILPFSKLEIEALKGGKKDKTRDAICKAEEEQLMKALSPRFVKILFDEQGKQFTSTHFAEFMEKQVIKGGKGIQFFIGGAYGFSDNFRKQADASVSLSPMTFSHQLVRLVALEQIYRALTIINGHPYHHS